jgi:hypothetical protein
MLLTTSPLFAVAEQTTAIANTEVAWWIWFLLLFVVSFSIGLVAVIAGVGGGVLFVPIISSFFPFHLDFVRCTGLLVALSGALSAGPGLLRKGMANLRLAIPIALIASTSSIIGAMLGLALPTNVVRVALGVAIVGIVIIMLKAKKSEFPEVKKPDALSCALKISGIYHEETTGEDINWQTHRTPLGFVTFIFIGVLAGMFGLGAGWANVPTLNLIMGVPLKVSVATSKFLLSITDTSAAWIYINKGAILPMLVIPSMVGIMLGSIIGVKLLTKVRPKAVRYIVIGVLLFAGIRAIAKGFGY